MPQTGSVTCPPTASAAVASLGEEWCWEDGAVIPVLVELNGLPRKFATGVLQLNGALA